MKPLFSDKTPKNIKIMLSEDNKIVSNPNTCAEIFNTFFTDDSVEMATKSSNITQVFLGSFKKDTSIINFHLTLSLNVMSNV